MDHNLLGRSLRVSQLESRHDHKRLGQSDQDVRGGLDPDVDAFGGRVVDVVLQDAGVDHGDGDKEEAAEDAGSGVEVDLVIAESGVHDHYSTRRKRLVESDEGEWERAGALTIQERNEDDQSNRIEVLQQVVGRAVQGHLPRLRDEVVPDLDPADEVEGQEEEHLAAAQAALHLGHVRVRVAGLAGEGVRGQLSVCLEGRRLGVLEAFLAPGGGGHAGGVEEGGALRGDLGVLLLAEEEDGGGDYDGAEKVCQCRMINRRQGVICCAG